MVTLFLYVLPKKSILQEGPPISISNQSSTNPAKCLQCLFGKENEAISKIVGM